MQLTFQQKQIHERALTLAKHHRKVESQLIQILQQVDQSKLFKKLGQPSLYMYATEVLGLSESISYSLISVARKSREFPQLQEAIAKQQLSAAKASRIVSKLRTGNAVELIEYAKNHKLKEIEFKLAEENPAQHVYDRVTPL